MLRAGAGGELCFRDLVCADAKNDIFALHLSIVALARGGVHRGNHRISAIEPEKPRRLAGVLRVLDRRVSYGAIRRNIGNRRRACRPGTPIARSALNKKSSVAGGGLPSAGP